MSYADRKAYKDLWRKANRDKVNRYNRERYARNPKKVQACHSRWVAKNREKVRIYLSRYYALNAWRWNGYALAALSKNPWLPLISDFGLKSLDNLGEVIDSGYPDPSMMLMMKEEYEQHHFTPKD